MAPSRRAMPATAPSSAERGRFAGVEGLRAVAAIAVLVSHVAAYSGSAGPDFWGRALNATQIGVTIFFLISGFVLYRPFLLARAAGRSVAVASYARRRFFRIAPPYWAILTALAIWPGLSGGVLGDHALKYYGFAQIYGSYDILGGLRPAWSLCTEVTFYAALPVLAWCLRATRARSRGALLEIAALAALAVAAALFHKYTVDAGRLGLGRTLPANLDWFALGMIVAVLSVDAAALPAWMTRWTARPALALAAAAGVYLVITREAFPDHVLMGVASFLVLAALVLGPKRAALHRVLSTRGFTEIGLISYSVFLLHDPLAHWLADRTHGSFAGVLVLTLAVTIPLSWLSFRLLEAPSMRLGRAGSAKRQAAAGADDAVAP